MQFESLKQIYSSKTDDELLALAADADSLAEESRPVLLEELRQRNLSEQPTPYQVEASHSSRRDFFGARARWLGLWLLHTSIATYGVAFVAGLLTDMLKPFITHSTKIHIVLTPYYPFTLLIAFIVGFLSYTRFCGSYRFWVWILPAICVLYFLFGWKATNQTSWSGTLFHFFGDLPYPENRDQLDTSLLLYLSLTYSLGAWAQTLVGDKLTDFSKLRNHDPN